MKFQQTATSALHQKYLTFYERLAKSIRTGRFAQISAAQQQLRLHRLQRYERQLHRYGIAVASAGALFFATAPSLSAQTPVGGEFRVNTYTTNTQRFSKVAMDSEGNFVVVWTGEGTGDTYGVYAQRYNRSGVAQSSEFRVNTYTTGNQVNPSVAMDSDGDFVVAWASYNQEGASSSLGIYARRYNSSGTAQSSSEFLVNTYTTGRQSSPSVAMDSDGDFVVAWASLNQEGVNSSYGVYARRYNSSGTAESSSEFLVNTYTTTSQSYPSVAMDSDGNFVVAWAGRGTGDDNGIYTRRYNSSGVAQSSEFLVNTYTTRSQFLPSVAMDSDGDFVVAWQSYTQEGTLSQYGTYARRYNSSGTAQSSSEFLVNTYTTSAQGYPSVAMDSDGNFVVAWQSYNQEGASSRYGVYAQRYNSSGTPQGSEFRVNSYTTSNQSFPSVAMDSDGDFIVAWNSRDQEGASSGFGIYAQRYSACSGSPLCSPIPTAAGTYTATQTTTSDGYTHYLDASGNLLLSLKVPTGTTIPAAAVKVKVGATALLTTTQYCGGTNAATSCFVSAAGGGKFIDRTWHIDPALVTGTAISGTNRLQIVSYFSDSEYTDLTGGTGSPAKTALVLYQPRTNLTFSPFTDVTAIKPLSSILRHINGTAATGATWLLSAPRTGLNGVEFQVSSLKHSGGIGIF